MSWSCFFMICSVSILSLGWTLVFVAELWRFDSVPKVARPSNIASIHLVEVATPSLHVHLTRLRRSLSPRINVQLP